MAEQDVRMNQFQEAEDASFIYAEAADGSQVKISKQSLASIIKTEMENRKLFPFMYFKNITNNDCNACIGAGYYYLNSYETEIANIPPIGNYGGLIVFPCNAYILQIAFDIYKDSLFVRNSHDRGNNWRNWRTI